MSPDDVARVFFDWYAGMAEWVNQAVTASVIVGILWVMSFVVAFVLAWKAQT